MTPHRALAALAFLISILAIVMALSSSDPGNKSSANPNTASGSVPPGLPDPSAAIVPQAAEYAQNGMDPFVLGSGRLRSTRIAAPPPPPLTLPQLPTLPLTER